MLLVAAASLAALCGCQTVSRALRPFGLTSAPGYAYEVEIAGVGGQLKDRLEEVSVLFSRKDEPPPTLHGLRQRAQGDRDLLLRVLRARGWYDGGVEWRVDHEARPARVEIRVERGGRYKFARFDISGLPPQASDLSTTQGLAILGVIMGAPALAETVIEAENRIMAALADRGFPYALPASRAARVDRDARTMEVAIDVDAGPRAKFGEVTVEGLDSVDDIFVLRRLKFERGEVFSPAKIEESKKTLFSAGVFSAVTMSWGERGDVGPDGQAPIRVLVAESRMHSVGAGLKYSSADGPGGRVFWETRNLSGGADRLRTEAEVAKQVTTGGISYRRPDWFGVVDQSLLLDVRADSDDFPAYDRYALMGSAGVERAFTKRLVGTVGLLVEQDDVNSKALPARCQPDDPVCNDPGYVDPDSGTRRFTLVGFPLGLRYDASDNLLDPSSGHRTFVSLTPYVSVLGDSVQMLVTRATESLYVALRDDHRLVWATRVSLGSVIGPERDDVPADKRMYAGGGDSVRGYEFQFVGPLVDAEPEISKDGRDPCLEADPPGKCFKPNFRPLGGRSLLQTGTELRWKATENFGVVPFVEGASVYQASYPDFGEKYLWSAGLGLRYFTVAGPIRFDVGFPLNPRQPDSVFEIYISLGQAF